MAVKRGKKQAKRSGESSVPGYVWLLTGLLIGGVAAITLYVKMPHSVDSLLPHPNPAAQPIAASDGGVAHADSVAIKSPVEPKKPEYDFYKLLPEKEVIIPDEELSAQVKAEAAAKLASQQQATPTPVTTASTAVIAGTTTATNPTTPSATTTATPTTTAVASVTPSIPPVANTAPPPAAKVGQYLLQAGAFRNNKQADDLKARIAMLGLVGHVEIVQTPAGAMHRVRLGPYATASELESAKQKLGTGGLPAVAIRVK
ncbi:MAG: SPOR domain-containing protein [Gemmatimonadaceae bacterium]